MKYPLIQKCSFARCLPCSKAETYEKVQLDRVRAYLKTRNEMGPKLTGGFLDIGAHVGLWSLHLYEYYQSLGVVPNVTAFEPDADNFKALCANTEWPNVTPTISTINAGCYSYTGKAQLHRTKHCGGHYVAADGDETIDLFMLDDVKGVIPQLDVIKIDIEGAELHAINGATKVLSSQRNCLIVCEYSLTQLARFGHNARQLTEQFGACGFRVASNLEERAINRIKAGQLWRIFFIKGEEWQTGAYKGKSQI
jgi:FkbM family methyltransferase